MDVIKAPDDYRNAPHPWIYLAGSIEMGKAEDWQTRVITLLEQRPGTLLNPRRDDWEKNWTQSADNPKFREQVEWELKAQEDADLIFCYFSPGTYSPISLLELGLFYSKMVVCCPKGFWRKGNVDIVCKRYKVPQVNSLKIFAEIYSNKHLKERRFPNL